MPVSSSALPAQPAAAVVAHPGEEIAERQGALTLGAVRLVNHGRLAAAVALDAEEPRREGAERLAQGLGGRGERVVTVAAPVPPGRLPKARHDRLLAAIWRFISRNSASAASPRRLCSSGVISGTSPNLPRRGFFAVTIADLRSSPLVAATGAFFPCTHDHRQSAACALRFRARFGRCT